MIPMLGKAWRDLRWSALWFGLGGAAYTCGILAYFPSVRDNPIMTTFIHSYPRSLVEALGVTNMTTFTGFLGAEILNVIWPLLMAVFAVMAGSAVVAREIESGTVEIWLSVPASRVRLLAAKLVILFLLCVLLAAATAAATVAMAYVLGSRLSLVGVLAMTAEMAGFVLVVAFVAAALSALVSERSQAAGIAGSLAVLTYVVWVISRLAEGWTWAGNLSLFSVYQPQRALESGSFDFKAVAVMLFVSALGALVALVAFQRRDAIA